MKLRFLTLACSGMAVFLLGVAPPPDLVPFQFAQKNALVKCAGKIETSSLEQVNSIWVYRFQIHVIPKKTCKVSVDAMTGLIRSNEMVFQAGVRDPAPR